MSECRITYVMENDKWGDVLVRWGEKAKLGEGEGAKLGEGEKARLGVPEG
jgi:hypothetical protein